MTAPSFSFTRYFFLPLPLAAPHAITENENMGRGKICGDKFFQQLYLVGWEFYWLFLPSRGASLPIIGITSTVQVLKNSDMEGWEGMECVAEWAALGLLNWKG